MMSVIKETLGRVRAAAALYDALRPRRPRTRYNLEQLAAHLPAAVHDARRFAHEAVAGRKLVVFATLHYWIEQAVVVGLALRAMGHEVTVAFLPYSSWQEPINRFDLQRQDLYTRRVLSPLNGLLKCISLLDVTAPGKLPCELEPAIETASNYDAMYSLQAENVDRESDLYKLRLERNRLACMAALRLLQSEHPDTVLTPNGLVTELGIFYRTARHLGLPVVTYEFNDQREQVWIAQDDIVMHQNTDGLWQARGGTPLTNSERKKIVEFEQARSQAQTYGKGTRLWQHVPTTGSNTLRTNLNLDGRPVVLLATNVLGDSLTLGRHIFAASMAEWIDKTVRYFVDRKDIQLVVRVHPGERLTKGGSMMDVVERAAAGRRENVRAIGPNEAINTYDLIGLASLGLAYTTTVGMEMALQGLPVVLAGETHYRGRGFTVDPSTWDEYFAALGDIMANPGSHRLSPDRVEAAWNYAYRFFFEFPFDFPWRLMHFWRDFDQWPIRRVLSAEGQAAFGRTFGYLAGEGIRW